MNHLPYIDVRTQRSIIKYIAEHLDETSHQIYSSVSERAEHLYYWWFRLNESNWKCDEDQVTPALRILREAADVELIAVDPSGGVQAIAFLFSNAISHFAARTVEACMDATYMTKRKNMELVRLLSEHDGVGFPLGYMLMTTTEEIEDGAKSQVLAAFLSAFKSRDIAPCSSTLARTQQRFER